MAKVIKVQDGNYKRLLLIIHELERINNERASFDDAISMLINEYEKKHKRKLNKSEIPSNLVTR